VSTLIEQVKADGLPRHVALIMDGNGRWAKVRGLPRTAGHEAGAQTVETIVRHVARNLSIPYLTLYAFSTENWRRPRPEVRFVLTLIEDYVTKKLSEFVHEGIRLRFLGKRSQLPRTLKRIVERSELATQTGTRLALSVALNYGGREELAMACKAIACLVRERAVNPEKVNASMLSSFLYSAGLPDPDLVIRTGGEKRLSNFLLWQAAYSELYFTDVLWPDFRPADLHEAISEYQQRERSFGA